MAIGAYTMAILTPSTDMSFWLSLPDRDPGHGRLRPDRRPAVAAPARRLPRDRDDRRRRGDPADRAERPRPHQRRPGDLRLRRQLGLDISDSIEELHRRPRLDRLPRRCSRCSWSSGCWRSLLIVRAHPLQRTPVGPRPARGARGRGRGPRARQERLLLQAPVAGDPAAPGAIAGFFLALNLTFVVPDEFEPLVTFFGYAVLVLGGLANYWGVAVGAIIFWTRARGPALPRAAALGDEDRGAALHHPRPRPDPADGVPAAGHLRQARGDGPR